MHIVLRLRGMISRWKAQPASTPIDIFLENLEKRDQYQLEESSTTGQHEDEQEPTIRINIQGSTSITKNKNNVNNATSIYSRLFRLFPRMEKWRGMKHFFQDLSLTAAGSFRSKKTKQENEEPEAQASENFRKTRTPLVVPYAALRSEAIRAGAKMDSEFVFQDEPDQVFLRNPHLLGLLDRFLDFMWDLQI